MFAQRHPFLSWFSTVIWAIAATIVVCWIISIAWPTRASAHDCPPGAAACRVLTLTPQEEAILLQERGILATAAEGRKIELEAATMYFRNRIQSAPAGEVKKPDEPK